MLGRASIVADGRLKKSLRNKVNLLACMYADENARQKLTHPDYRRRSCAAWAQGEPTVLRNFQPRHRLASTRRHYQATPIRSEDEAYYRTGLSSSAVTQEQASKGEGWRSMPLFAADAQRKDKGADDCTKHLYSSGALAPGLMVRPRVDYCVARGGMQVLAFHSASAARITESVTRSVSIQQCLQQRRHSCRWCGA